MIDDQIIYEIRKMLEQEILVEVRAIAAKLDCMQETMERHQKAIDARLDALLADLAAYQAERKEQLQEREDFPNDAPPPKRLLQ
jgi:hypothetical protein